MKNLIILFFCLINNSINAQSPSTGIFGFSSDIGNPTNKGSSAYSETDQSYSVRGSGYNIWFERDEFHYLYNNIRDNFILTANFRFEGNGIEAHRKTGWMIRCSTDDDSPHISAVVHGDGLTLMQWRDNKGGSMKDPEDQIFAKGSDYEVLQMERAGKYIFMRAAHSGEPLENIGSCEMINMPDEILAGLFVCCHNTDVTEEATIWNVRIDRPVSGNYNAGREGYLGCRLETMNVFDGKRMVIYEKSVRFEAPNWLPDGKKLLFNMDGLLYKIPVTGGQPEQLNTGFANRNNNDHGISFNGNLNGIMQIWRMRPDGTAMEQLTFDKYNDWFPHISPDGKWIVFISFPADIDPNSHPSYKRVMLRLMPAAGGEPEVIAWLYGGQGTINVPSWSPDSKQIAFVSNSGK